jgi:Ca2+-binding RTX toxin-like protein
LGGLGDDVMHGDSGNDVMYGGNGNGGISTPIPPPPERTPDPLLAGVYYDRYLVFRGTSGDDYMQVYRDSPPCTAWEVMTT